MIIVKLMGGLGNQMFQYALARHLSIIHKTKLKLDLTFLLDRTPRENFVFRNFELDIFNIKAEIATNKDIDNFFVKPKSTKWQDRLLEHISPHSIKNEKYFHFDADILNSQENTYLEGYWQSEKYFKHIEKIIRNDFIFKNEANELNGTFLKQILEPNSVAIHIRRGDYEKNPSTNAAHGLCSLEYYQKAIQIITQQIKQPHFYIFSDDNQWAIDNFKIELPTTYITQNSTKRGFEDLRLMQNCKHFIIANSSFSWWAAWLSVNKNKIVIAPEKWFNEHTKLYDTPIDKKDLLPNQWITI